MTTEITSPLSEDEISRLFCKELLKKETLAYFLLEKFFEESGHTYSDFTDLQCRFSEWNNDGQREWEIDIKVEYTLQNSQQVVFLIENKITAGFQPDQPERYKRFAENHDAYTILLAPAGYIKSKRKGPEQFNFHLTYEEVICCLEKDSSPSAQYLADALEKAPQPDDKVAAVWHFVDDLTTKNPTLKNLSLGESRMGSGSTWMYFNDSKGLSVQTKSLRPSLIYKTEKGVVELMFYQVHKEELEKAVGKHLSDNMSVDKIGSSPCVYISVPIIDYTGTLSPEDQTEKITEGLEALESLRDFYQKHQDYIHRCLKS